MIGLPPKMAGLVVMRWSSAWLWREPPPCCAADALVPRGVYRFDSFDEADTIDSARRGDLSYCFS
jgi:hypothetical protein